MPNFSYKNNEYPRYNIPHWLAQYLQPGTRNGLLMQKHYVHLGRDEFDVKLIILYLSFCTLVCTAAPCPLLHICTNNQLIRVGDLWDLVSDITPSYKFTKKYWQKIGLISPKMHVLIFWLNGQHASIVLHLIMQYKPHLSNHPWDLAPDRWKICPKISKSKFDYPAFRQKSKFWHSDKTGIILGPCCIFVQRISSYELAISEIWFRTWPHPTNLLKNIDEKLA